MSELDLACLKLKQALYNPYAITRHEAKKRDVAEAWKSLQRQTAQKKNRARRNSLALYI